MSLMYIYPCVLHMGIYRDRGFPENNAFKFLITYLNDCSDAFYETLEKNRRE